MQVSTGGAVGIAIAVAVVVLYYILKSIIYVVWQSKGV